VFIYHWLLLRGAIVPIQRSGPTPAYHEYITRFSLVDQQNQLPAEVRQLRAEPLKIPTFQRGISWGSEDVFRFLESSSVLYGNVIVGQLGGAGVLVDGLQRFAVGTILLNLLFPRVLSPTPSNAAAATSFVRLRAMIGNFQPVFANNHFQLSQHSREAIRNQYNLLYQELDGILDTYLAPQKLPEFASQIERCFLDRQVAIDIYFNFSNQIELANTFIGLNTVRVDLSTVDLIRAFIIDRADSCNPPWPPEVVPETENDITETFTLTTGAPRRDLLPTATVVLKALQSPNVLQNPLNPQLIFPSWNNLQQVEVNRFLDFLNQVILVTEQSSYLLEIRESGALPLAIVILFYYRQLLQTGQQPSFLTGGNTEDQALHRFLRATYRALLEGSIGRLGPIAESALSGQYAALDEASEAVVRTTGSGSLNADPPRDWVAAHLASVDLKKARRVFNACVLPNRGAAGIAYSPLRFGRKEGEWHIDHLIPARRLNENAPGYDEGNRIRNFAPLPSNYNRNASNTPCSAKLAAGGPYPICIQNPATSHLYMEWLVQNQAGLQAALDSQQLLQPNAQPNVGDARVNAIVDLVIQKL
jgi:Protein of unknown function DUF262